MNVIEESRQKRPIAMAGLRLIMLCDHPDERTDDEYWALAKALLGEQNVNTWLQAGETHAREMVRKMLYKNLEVFQYADTTGEGFVNRLYEMYLAGDFADDTGDDAVVAMIMGQDRVDDFSSMMIDKMGVSPEVMLLCISAMKKRGEVIG